MRQGQPQRFAAGASLPPPAGSEAAGEGDGDDGPLARAYSADGRFIGIVLWSEQQAAWQPHKVLPTTLEVE
jgi:hypothetical protein